MLKKRKRKIEKKDKLVIQLSPNQGEELHDPSGYSTVTIKGFTTNRQWHLISLFYIDPDRDVLWNES